MAAIDHTAMTTPAAIPPGTPIRNARVTAASPALMLVTGTRPKRTQRHGEPPSPQQIVILSSMVYGKAVAPDCPAGGVLIAFSPSPGGTSLLSGCALADTPG